ncbi:NAD(P)/FAD-dependent oxidoreductase [Microbacterium sp. ZW T5_56]|uniref:NAD(P)/FAD-dependent oxidoreductase n=1 Tax=Microbacterium sp. ZW T5_56 TaxID=3378081 RepID=UPI0038530D22
MSDRVVVVGASIGGLTAAETLRQEGYAGEIVLIGSEAHLPYNRPPLSKQILLGDWEGDDAVIRTETELAELDIRVRTGCRATGLDVNGRVLHTEQGDVAFDQLIIATGTAPRAHAAVPSALTLRTLDDAMQLRRRLRSARRVAVIGSGILGSEIASAARKHEAATLLIGRSASLGFGGVGALLSDQLIALHRDHGVDLSLGTEIVSSTVTASGATVLTFRDGSSHEVDLAVAMIGGTPQTRWLRSSGLDVSDGVACDIVGEAAPGISAVGDVAAWTDPISGRPRRVEHQSYAIEQAIAVALRLQHGRDSTPPVPLFWSEIHGVRINAYGWFDPTHRLTDDTPAEETPERRVYGSRDDRGDLRGVIGWNATPRAFRAARAAVVTAPHSIPVPEGV